MRLSAGFVVGGYILDETQNFLTGGLFQYSYNIKINNRIGTGYGVGVDFLEKDFFIPLYLNSVAFITPEERSPFVDFQTGYSVGWSGRYKDYDSYNFNGGLMHGGGIDY
ncbi:MAG: hypothetical protein JW894_16555 [Bacteroidales bacterium]|nr:hypothetical protein [Bacteroidales bacterium]